MAVLTNLLFVLTFGLTVTTEVDLQKRIIGGGDCLEDERAYHVRFEHPGGYLLCGGSLISDRWILTAAHCWKGDMIPVLSPHQGSRQPGQLGNVHLLQEADIMVVQLEQPTNISHIRLPDCDNRHLRIGDVVRIAGHGSNRVGPTNIRVDDEVQNLQCANFTVIDRDHIGDQKFFRVNTNQFDFAKGDSGGGVVLNNAIYGVVQGIFISKRAHVGPATFVDVCHYIDWIRAKTEIFN